MATSSVQIANSALVKLGITELLTAMSDSNVRGRTMNEQYDKCRKMTLRSHPWNFAMTRTSLTAEVTTPDFGWDYQFVLPSDCLRVWHVGELDSDDIKWIRESNKILCDEESVDITYIKNVTDTTLFDAMFEEALALCLAADTCFALTQNRTLAADLKKEFEMAVRVGRSIDAQEANEQKQVQANTWLDERR
jgi:hypothetical protein